MQNKRLSLIKGGSSLAELLVVFLLTIMPTALWAQKAADNKKLAGLDTTINRLLKEWHASGCSVAIVDGKKTVYAKGFGYKDYQKHIPVTENTLFAIGSCSKAFTASLIGMAADEGKIDLDKPVADCLPELKFYNEYLSAHVTARDMMCHRTGLPRHDYVWYGSSIPRDSLIYRIRFLEPSAELRQRWQYNNFMYLALGVLAEKIYGDKWENLVEEKIMQPLGMSTSNFSVTNLVKSPDFTYGYRDSKDSVIRMEYMNIDQMGPAGSINSSATEMASWVSTWINSGRFNNKKILPPGYVPQAISGQMIIGGGLPQPDFPDIYGSEYGFGWFLLSYRGHYRVEHGGNIDGFSASVAFFPTDSIGIVVLTNQNGSVLPAIIRNIIADRMLNLPKTDWSGKQKEAMAKNKLAMSGRLNSDSLNRKLNTHPSHPLSDYAGAYENAGYGRIDMRLKKDTLWLDFHKTHFNNYLSHYHYDIFSVINAEDEDSDGSLKASFQTDEKGNIASFTLPLEPTVEDILFTKLPPTLAIRPRELEKYTGDYELNGLTIKVYIRQDSTLMVLVPGQPDYELVATKKDEFDFKALKGFSVKFDVSGDRVTAINFHQPNGIFKAKKK